MKDWLHAMWLRWKFYQLWKMQQTKFLCFINACLDLNIREPTMWDLDSLVRAHENSPVRNFEVSRDDMRISLHMLDIFQDFDYAAAFAVQVLNMTWWRRFKTFMTLPA